MYWTVHLLFHFHMNPTYTEAFITKCYISPHSHFVDPTDTFCFFILYIWKQTSHYCPPNKSWSHRCQTAHNYPNISIQNGQKFLKIKKIGHLTKGLVDHKNYNHQINSLGSIHICMVYFIINIKHSAVPDLLHDGHQRCPTYPTDL